MEKLALYGGEPVRNKPWPQWPYSSPELEEEIIQALRSQRWTISGFYQDQPSYEEKFSKAFAEYNNSGYCIPTANGTSALLCSLQALGIGPGDEVIVPGLTWVACAVTVVSLNAIPILVDVEEETMCLSPQKVEQAITARTKAIMVVHLYSAIANMDQLLQISKQYKIPIIEDCAQAHGATWNGRRVGTLGAVGTFSMQQGKALTSGEGGAVITNDPELAEKIYVIRTNARRKSPVKPKPGYMELEEVGGTFATNYCLSEISCAILLNKLKSLDQENARREKNRQILSGLLSEVTGIHLTKSSPGTTSATIYHLPLKIDLSMFGHEAIEKIGQLLSAELGAWIHRPYIPLNAHPLYATDQCRLAVDKEALASSRFNLPTCWNIHNTHLLLHHSLFLGEAEDMMDIKKAIEKIKKSLV